MKTLSAKRNSKIFYYQYYEEDVSERYVLAYPVGGGFQRSVPREDIISMDATIPVEISTTTVGFAEGCPTYKAYIFANDRWNGWLQPYVEKDQLLKFIKDQADDPHVEDRYNLRGNTLVVNQSMGDDEYTHTVEAKTITYNGKEIKVWGIGLGLCWTDMEEE